MNHKMNCSKGLIGPSSLVVQSQNQPCPASDMEVPTKGTYAMDMTNWLLIQFVAQ